MEDIPDTILISIIDPDNSNHIIWTESISLPDSIVFAKPDTISTDSLIYLSKQDWNGSADIMLRVKENENADSLRLSNTNSFTLNIEPVNDPPPKVQLVPELANVDSIYINENNINTDSLMIQWLPSIDVDRDDVHYIFDSFLDVFAN